MSTAIIITDFDQMEQFINNMDHLMSQLYQSQDGVNYAYNHISQWYDPVRIHTGNVLQVAGNNIEQLSEFLGKKIAILNHYCQTLYCEYLENKDWNGQFRSRILEVPIHTEDQQMKQAILGTTAEGIQSFEKELDKYIEATKQNVAKVVQAMDDVRPYWKDENFRVTEAYILNFQNDMRNHLSSLSLCLDWIGKRRKVIEAAENNSQQLKNN